MRIGWDEEEFFEFVFLDYRENDGHCEGGSHENFSIEERSIFIPKLELLCTSKF